eukprot:774577-Rhodomonas_salina.1
MKTKHNTVHAPPRAPPNSLLPTPPSPVLCPARRGALCAVDGRCGCGGGGAGGEGGGAVEQGPP